MVNKDKIAYLDRSIRLLQKSAYGLVAKFNGRSWGTMKYNVTEIKELVKDIERTSKELAEEDGAERDKRGGDIGTGG